jgi:hypothetical protein
MMIVSNEERAIFDAVRATFPVTFGLRGFPGEKFRISVKHSYFNQLFPAKPSEASLMLYTERLRGDTWSVFTKGTVKELRRNVVT